MSDPWIPANPWAPEPLDTDVVHVWRLALPAGAEWDGLPLPPADAARLAEFRLPDRAAEFRRLRAWLRCLLRSYAGAEQAGRDFLLGEHGKPSLPDSPVHFNLSHTRDLALAAFSRTAPVGVDVERLDRRADVENLALRYFHPAEREQMTGDPDPSRAFMRVWTAKEALLKARGWGISLPLVEMDTTTPPPDLRLDPLPLPHPWIGTLAHSSCSVRCFSTQ